MWLKKWEGGKTGIQQNVFWNIVLCLSCSKYNNIDTALLVHVINAQQCPEFRLTWGQRLERCMGSNQSLCVLGTLRLKEACVPFIFCAWNLHTCGLMGSLIIAEFALLLHFRETVGILKCFFTSLEDCYLYSWRTSGCTQLRVIKVDMNLPSDLPLTGSTTFKKW